MSTLPLYRDDHDGTGREAFMTMLSALNIKTSTPGCGEAEEDDGQDQPPVELGEESEVRRRGEQAFLHFQRQVLFTSHTHSCSGTSAP